MVVHARARARKKERERESPPVPMFLITLHAANGTEQAVGHSAHQRRGMWKDGGWFRENVSCCFPTLPRSRGFPFQSGVHVRPLSLCVSLSRTHAHAHARTCSFYLSVPLELYLSGWMLEFFVLFNKAASLSLCESFPLFLLSPFSLSFLGYLPPVRLIAVFAKRFKAMFSDGVFCATKDPHRGILPSLLLSSSLISYCSLRR